MDVPSWDFLGGLKALNLIDYKLNVVYFTLGELYASQNYTTTRIR